MMMVYCFEQPVVMAKIRKEVGGLGLAFVERIVDGGGDGELVLGWVWRALEKYFKKDAQDELRANLKVLSLMLAELVKSGLVVEDNLDWLAANLLNLSFSPERVEAYLLPIWHQIRLVNAPVFHTYLTVDPLL